MSYRHRAQNCEVHRYRYDGDAVTQAKWSNIWCLSCANALRATLLTLRSPTSAHRYAQRVSTKSPNYIGDRYHRRTRDYYMYSGGLRTRVATQVHAITPPRRRHPRPCAAACAWAQLPPRSSPENHLPSTKQRGKPKIKGEGGAQLTVIDQQAWLAQARPNRRLLRRVEWDHLGQRQRWHARSRPADGRESQESG